MIDNNANACYNKHMSNKKTNRQPKRNPEQELFLESGLNESDQDFGDVSSIDREHFDDEMKARLKAGLATSASDRASFLINSDEFSSELDKYAYPEVSEAEIVKTIKEDEQRRKLVDQVSDWRADVKSAESFGNAPQYKFPDGSELSGKPVIFISDKDFTIVPAPEYIMTPEMIAEIGDIDRI
jgi:hypothetical protein